mgnify:CR=1 FL=1
MSQLVLSLEGVRLERDGSLTDRALRVLSAEPLPSVEVASRVLGITGGAGAAASAVFTLLGGDPRFRVDAQGIWSVAPPPSAEEPAIVRPLREESFVVVDVETTGGSPWRGHRVTEVAAVRVQGGRIADTYSTLVNPERPIPSMITGLTGITQAMVADQPRFAQVARQVSAALDAALARVFDGRERVLWEGAMWGGTHQRIIGYGSMVQRQRSSESSSSQHSPSSFSAVSW